MLVFFFFFKQKTAYEMRISDWSSDVCSSDLSGLQLPSRGKQAIGDRAQHYVDRDEEGDGSRHRMRHRRIHRPDEAIAKAHDRVIDGVGVRDRLEPGRKPVRSDEHTSELQSLMRISYAVFCLKKKKKILEINNIHHNKYKYIIKVINKQKKNIHINYCRTITTK